MALLLARRAARRCGSLLAPPPCRALYRSLPTRGKSDSASSDSKPALSISQVRRSESEEAPPRACAPTAAKESESPAVSRRESPDRDRCERRLDFVARRLAAAERARRADYEREAAARREGERVAPERAPYRLRDERGGERDAAAAGRRCAVSRLASAAGCEASRDRRPDPCRRRPDDFLDVDRPPLQDAPRSPPENLVAGVTGPPNAPPGRPPAPGGLTTRIAAAFRRGRPGGDGPRDSRCEFHTRVDASGALRRSSGPDASKTFDATVKPDNLPPNSALEIMLLEREARKEAGRPATWQPRGSN